MTSFEPEPKTLDLEERIVAALRRLVRAIDLHSRRLADDFGLTGPQLATLRAAERLRTTTMSELARAVHLGGPTMTGILTRLERRGLVERSRSDRDRRATTISVTSAGREVLARAPSLLQERFRAELLRLPEWERLSILSHLQRIAAMMDAEGLDAAPHLVSEQPLTPFPSAEPVGEDTSAAPRRRRENPRPRRNHSDSPRPPGAST